MERNGGQSHEVVSCFATGKALAQVHSQLDGPARKCVNKKSVGEMFVGRFVRRFCDGSPYFIYQSDTLRYVFCVERGRTVESGRFVLVTVELRNRPGEKCST